MQMLDFVCRSDRWEPETPGVNSVQGYLLRRPSERSYGEADNDDVEAMSREFSFEFAHTRDRF